MLAFPSQPTSHSHAHQRRQNPVPQLSAGCCAQMAGTLILWFGGLISQRKEVIARCKPQGNLHFLALIFSFDEIIAESFSECMAFAMTGHSREHCPARVVQTRAPFPLPSFIELRYTAPLDSRFVAPPLVLTQILNPGNIRLIWLMTVLVLGETSPPQAHPPPHTTTQRPINTISLNTAGRGEVYVPITLGSFL